MQIMVQSVTERVRLSAQEERRLADIAKRTRRTKSEVLRAGLKDQWEKVGAEEERLKAWDQLIRWADEIPGEPKLHLRVK